MIAKINKIIILHKFSEEYIQKLLPPLLSQIEKDGEGGVFFICYCLFHHELDVVLLAVGYDRSDVDTRCGCGSELHCGY